MNMCYDDEVVFNAEYKTAHVPEQVQPVAAGNYAVTFRLRMLSKEIDEAVRDISGLGDVEAMRLLEHVQELLSRKTQ